MALLNSELSPTSRLPVIVLKSSLRKGIFGPSGICPVGPDKIVHWYSEHVMKLNHKGVYQRRVAVLTKSFLAVVQPDMMTHMRFIPLNDIASLTLCQRSTSANMGTGDANAVRGLRISTISHYDLVLFDSLGSPDDNTQPATSSVGCLARYLETLLKAAGFNVRLQMSDDITKNLAALKKPPGYRAGAAHPPPASTWSRAAGAHALSDPAEPFDSTEAQGVLRGGVAPTNLTTSASPPPPPDNVGERTVVQDVGVTSVRHRLDSSSTSYSAAAGSSRPQPLASVRVVSPATLRGGGGSSEEALHAALQEEQELRRAAQLHARAAEERCSRAERSAQELSLSLSELTRTLAEKASEVDTLLEVRVGLQKELEDALVRLHEGDHALASMRRTAQDAVSNAESRDELLTLSERRRVDAEAAAAESAAQMLAAREMGLEAKAEKEQLRSHLENVIREIGATKSALEVSNQTNRSLQDEIARLKDETGRLFNAERHGAIARAAAENSLQGATAASKATAEALQTRVTLAEAEVERARGDVAEARRAQRAAEQLSADQISSVQSANERVLKLERALTQSSAELQEMRRNLKDTLDVRDAEGNEVGEAVAALHRQLWALRLHHESKVADLEKQLAAARSTRTETLAIENKPSNAGDIERRVEALASGMSALMQYVAPAEHGANSDDAIATLSMRLQKETAARESLEAKLSQLLHSGSLPKGTGQTPTASVPEDAKPPHAGVSPALLHELSLCRSVIQGAAASNEDLSKRLSQRPSGAASLLLATTASGAGHFGDALEPSSRMQPSSDAFSRGTANLPVLSSQLARLDALQSQLDAATSRRTGSSVA